MTYRTVLVDDEPLARKRLRRLVEHPEVEIVGEAGDGDAASRMIDALAPDLALLDIQMPACSGFQVLARLARRPHVIFVTAYDEFAVKAFEEQALDYLLKPVEPPRLARALARLTTPTDARIDRLLEAVERQQVGRDKIPVRQGNRVTLVEAAAVVWPAPRTSTASCIRSTASTSWIAASTSSSSRYTHRASCASTAHCSSTSTSWPTWRAWMEAATWCRSVTLAARACTRVEAGRGCSGSACASEAPGSKWSHGQPAR